MPHIRIGTSGWTYSTWKGRFYPAGLPVPQQLAYLSTRLNAVELNGTFYRLQRPSTYAKWASQVTDDFEFAVKGWKQVTHIRRLRDAQPDVARFFASGVLDLGTHLGPILWQLPPSLKFDASALDTFLADLPQTVGEARELAASVPAEDDAEDAQPALLPVPEPDDPAPEVPASTPLRYAIEPRNATFGAPEALQTLQTRYDRLEAFAQAVGLGKALDSRTFTRDLFETDKDIAGLVKDFNKANPSATSTALSSTAGGEGKTKHDPNELLRIAAGR